MTYIVDTSSKIHRPKECSSKRAITSIDCQYLQPECAVFFPTAYPHVNTDTDTNTIGSAYLISSRTVQHIVALHLHLG